MSVATFRERLAKSRLHPDDIKWMPKWMTEFAKDRTLVNDILSFDETDVLKFLQRLRDQKTPAWQRLQAARSLEWYQTLVIKSLSVDFTRFKLKLREIAEQEKRAKVPANTTLSQDEGFDGEGRPGICNSAEPVPVQQLRARMRVLHHPISTENTYADWISRLVRHLDDEKLGNYGEEPNEVIMCTKIPLRMQ
jgi:hypothetical protein